MNLLQSNLQEIYAAIHADQPALVADLFGSRVYASNAGWGKFWSWTGSSYFKPDGLRQAIQYTHQIFQQQLNEITKTSHEYRQVQEKLRLGEQIPESTIIPIRNKLIQWFESTTPFLRLLKCNSKLQNLLHQYLPTSEEPFFSCGVLTKQLQWQRRLIQLESIIGSSFPISVLTKVSLRTPITEEEDKTLQKFARKINKIPLEINNFHKALLGVTEIGQNKPATSKAEITELEMALFNKGCEIFNRIDPDHISWKNTLKEGDTLTCNSRELIVGERICAKLDPEKDDNWIFTVKNDPNVVLSIGINRVSHFLKRKLANDYGWGIEHAKYIDIDEKGRFALLERLYDPLDGYPWKSVKGHFSPQDKVIAEPISGLLKWLLAQGKTPLHFDPKYLLFNKEGALRCVKVALESRFNFTAMVEFIKCCVRSNIEVYKYIVRNSGIDKHVYTVFFQQVIQYAMEGKTTTVEDLAAGCRVPDNRVVQKSADLQKEVLALRQKCVLQIYQNFETRNVLNIEQEIGKCILSEYISCCAIGDLPSQFEDRVIQQIVKNKHLQARK